MKNLMQVSAYMFASTCGLSSLLSGSDVGQHQHYAAHVARLHDIL